MKKPILLSIFFFLTAIIMFAQEEDQITSEDTESLISKESLMLL